MKKFSGSSSASHSVIFSGSHFKEGLVTIPHAHVKNVVLKCSKTLSTPSKFHPSVEGRGSGG